ncbi:Phosphoribosylglycinamide synthetase, C domain [Musa troglodytarum]|uniref:Phosphoribosylglycinamide synthetase, C domain n=1 Tax=Musa troglodytarum TaxID=320322 RepID=A0A9E7I735_9LILI|nr:Phosphoribosylglycinamide synthetase, C domain [Musa troglodytarum]URE42153.1 Phosphoribosylglycinamide synthetase, C domain [Musa troglodytarum]
MKDSSDRTKVVVRHLPPSISQSVLMEQIDGRFAGRYDWVFFRPGKNSQKNQRHSRAYLNFERSEDVVEFAEFFYGHIFVNEKGAHFKAVIEYAPSQRVPRPWSKKDVCEGTLSKDREYMDFLGLLSKPVEHLPSAEIQLERKEAERAGGTKESLIVTPLMDFVRRKRAAKGGVQGPCSGGKVSRRTLVVSTGSSSPSKRGSEKRKYVSRETLKRGKTKDKPSYILTSRREEQRPSVDKSASVASAIRKEALEDDFASVIVESGKSRIILLKGKEKEGSDPFRGVVQQQVVMSSVRNSPTSTSKHNRASGIIIRSILSKEGHLNQSCIAASHPELQIQAANVEKDKHSPLPPNASSKNDYISRSLSIASVSDGDDKRYMDTKVVAINNAHGSLSINVKREKQARKKDRHDRGIWALRRSDRAQPSDRTPSADAPHMLTDSLGSIYVSQQAADKVDEVTMFVPSACVRNGSNSHAAYELSLVHGERKADVPYISRSEDMKIHRGRSLSAVENGSHRRVGRRGSARGLKEVDNSLSLLEGKSSKRGSTGYSLHERQVWVQKAGSSS